MVRRGLARVASDADHRDGVRELLAIERQARRYRRGLWADPAYALIPASEAGRKSGRFGLVSGTVARVGSVSGGTVG
jgi:endonuclease YncB( thermonuclease family)